MKLMWNRRGLTIMYNVGCSFTYKWYLWWGRYQQADRPVAVFCCWASMHWYFQLNSELACSCVRINVPVSRGINALPRVKGLSWLICPRPRVRSLSSTTIIRYPFTGLSCYFNFQSGASTSDVLHDTTSCLKRLLIR